MIQSLQDLSLPEVAPRTLRNKFSDREPACSACAMLLEHRPRTFFAIITLAVRTI